MDFGMVTGFFSGIPFDILILVGAMIVIALDSLRSGIGRACAIALSLPIALSLVNLIEKTFVIKDVAILSSSARAEVISFAVMFLLVYLLVRRISLEYIESGMGEPVQALLASAAAVAVFVVVWMQFPASSVWPMGESVRAIFAEQYHFAWLMGSYLILAFARG